MLDVLAWAAIAIFALETSLRWARQWSAIVKKESTGLVVATFWLWIAGNAWTAWACFHLWRFR